MPKPLQIRVASFPTAEDGLEGSNSLFSATKRKARGYRTTKNLLTMLYFVAGKLKVPCY